MQPKFIMLIAVPGAKTDISQELNNETKGNGINFIP